MGKNLAHKNVESQLTQGLQQHRVVFLFFFPNSDDVPRAQEKDSPHLQGKGLGLSQQWESAEMMVALPSRNVSTSESPLNGNCWAPCAPLY